MNGKGGNDMGILPNEKARNIRQAVGLAMELNDEASIIYMQDDTILHFIGYIHYWNEEMDEIRVLNQFQDAVRIKLNEIVLLYTLGRDHDL